MRAFRSWVAASLTERYRAHLPQSGDCHRPPCFFFKQKTAYEISLGLVGSEMCIRDRTSFVPCQRNTRRPLSKLEGNLLPRKITVTSKSPVGDISVVTLIRTDTTLDHSQKAEKAVSYTHLTLPTKRIV